MAQYSFHIKSIEADLASQSVYIECSLDVDIDSINSGAIYIIRKGTNELVPFTVDVERNVIQIKLSQWAAPNETYTVMTNTKIESIVGDALDVAIHQDVHFKSKVDSTCEFMSPSNFAVTGPTPTIIWKESHPENQYVEKFYIEVATDPSFSNIIRKSFVPAPELVKGGES